MIGGGIPFDADAWRQSPTPLNATESRPFWQIHPPLRILQGALIIDHTTADGTMCTNADGRNLTKHWHRWLFSGEISEGTSYHD
jgi:hypothetical protein